MDRALYFSPSSWATALALEVSRAAKLHDFALRILHHFVAFNDISVFETHLATRSEPKIFRRRRFHEIISIDVQLAAERQLAGSSRRIFRIVDGFELFGFA